MLEDPNQKIEEPEYSGGNVANELSFSSRELAWKECPRCHGTGSVTQERADGSIHHLLCPCVILTQNRMAAEMRIKEKLPGRMGRMTFANFDTGGNKFNEQALRVAKNFVNNWTTAKEKGWILGFYGLPSAGKTHLASAIAIACVKRYFITPYILSVPRMLELQKQTFRAEMEGKRSPLEEAIEADLLVLDDLGAEYVKTRGENAVTWGEDFLYQILDERIKYDRPTVYTTNLTISNMKERLPARIYERLARNQAIEPQKVIRDNKRSRVNYDGKDLLLGGGN